MLSNDPKFTASDPGNFLRMKLNGQGLTTVRNDQAQALDAIIKTADERNLIADVETDADKALLIYDMVRLALELPASEIERIRT